jgi:hypothetical protein
MARLRAGPGFVIFLLFFGVATLEAVRAADWAAAAFWLAVGLAFLAASDRSHELVRRLIHAAVAVCPGGRARQPP